MPQYEIFADEAWTHNSPPLRRYHNFFGGIFGTESHLGALDTQLRQAIAATGNNQEIKWQHLTPRNVGLYMAFADHLFDAIRGNKVTYRQMFCDRSVLRVEPSGESRPTEIDVQFKLYYQFLKHCFGIKHLPDKESSEILVRLDGHSSQKHKTKLTGYAEELPGALGLRNLTVRLTFEQSERTPRIQVCDLLMGAAGSYGNKMHQLRENGASGMTPKQKARLEFAKFVYGNLKNINNAARGSGGFNWFETTGMSGDPKNMLTHPVRIWKFLPSRYQVDKGWQNDHLDKFGQYTKPDIQPGILTPGMAFDWQAPEND